MEWWHIYLFTRLDSVLGLLTIIAFLCVIILVSCVITFDNYPKETAFSAKVSGTLLLLSALAIVAIPNQKDMAAIYLIPKIANNESVQNIPVDFAKLIELKLKEFIKEVEEVK